MSDRSLKGNFIINGKPSILYTCSTNGLVWVPSSDRVRKHGKNQEIRKRSAKYRLVKERKINLDSLLSIEACYCDQSPLKKGIQCSACLKITRGGKSPMGHVPISSGYDNQDESKSTQSSSSISSSKSPSPVSAESSLLSDSSLGLVYAESSNESGNFSAQSALSLKQEKQENSGDKETKFRDRNRNQELHFSGEGTKQTEKETQTTKHAVNLDSGNFYFNCIKVLKIYYVIEKEGTKGRLLRPNSLTIEPPIAHYSSISSGPESSNQSNPLDELHRTIKRLTKDIMERRPKRLLVFINPYGGKGRAAEIYHSKVKHVFHMAHIDANVIVTEHANHAREMIENPTTDLCKYDGIICVGGDGMFAELMNGILFRANKKYIKSDDSAPTGGENKPEIKGEIEKHKLGLGGIGRKLETPTIPIGVIGAGSTDANSFGVIGTNDSVTAALNMVLGRRINIDICSIHSLKDDSKIMKFVSTFVSYGYFGDIIKNSESLRWLGPKRYDVCAAQNIVRHRSYAGEIKILLSPKDGSPSDGYRCGKNCLLCAHQARQGSSNSIDDETSSSGKAHIASSDGEDTYTSGEDSGNADYDDAINNNGHGNRVNNKKEKIRHKSERVRCEEDKNNNNQINHDDGNNNNNNLHDDNGPLYEKNVEHEDDKEYVIIKKKGSFVGINTAVMACRCPQTKKGLSPNNHLGNGCADLILVSPCSRIQYLKYLLRTGYTKKSAFDLEYVEAYRCRQFDFVAKHSDSKTGNPDDTDRLNDEQSNSSWNVDGELLTEPSIRVKVNCQLLPVFGTGEPTKIRRKIKRDYTCSLPE